MRAWRLLGGCDWSGLPIAAEILGCDDVEGLAMRLAFLRDELNKDDGQ